MAMATAVALGGCRLVSCVMVCCETLVDGRRNRMLWGWDTFSVVNDLVVPVFMLGNALVVVNNGNRIGGWLCGGSRFL